MKPGTFIRVRTDHDSFRAGKDGMVINDFENGTLGMFFGVDRHNQSQGVLESCGTELWHLDELDLNTVSD